MNTPDNRLALGDLEHLSKLGEASCRNISWLLQVGKPISSQDLFKNLPYSRDHLTNPNRFTDWVSYRVFISHLNEHLNQVEMIELARAAAASRYAVPLLRRLTYSVRDELLARFGESGEIARALPLEISTSEPASGVMHLDLQMLPGYSPSDALHLSLVGQIIGAPEALGLQKAEVEYQATGGGAHFVVNYRDRGGEARRARQLWQRINVHAVRLHDLEYHQTLLTTKLRFTEEQLQRTRTDSAGGTMPAHHDEVVLHLDPALKVTFCGDGIEQLSGRPAEQVCGMNLDDLLTTPANQSLPALTDVESHSVHDTRPVVFEVQLRHTDGSDQWIEGRARLERNDRGAVIGYMASVRNINERKHIALELQEREESYRVITTTAQDGIVTIDVDRIITFANPALHQMFDFDVPDLLGTSITEIMPSIYQILRSDTVDSTGKQDDAVATGGDRALPVAASLNGLTRSGQTLPVEVSFAAHTLRDERHFTGIVRDISQRQQQEHERKILEQQLQATQKIDSIGQLAGGVAHDFNNLLVAILGYTDLAANDSISSEDRRVYLHEIKLAGERAAEMTQQLLAFSRRQIIEPSLLDLNELVAGLDLMIQRLIPANIEISLVTSDDEVDALADRGQLEQILINLVVNARDAMPHGGQLVIETATASVDKGFADLNPWAEIGEYGLLRITDSGSGMSPDIRRHVFEPFFTTKPEGAGTGLGLAVVFGIVKQHNGLINVDSTEGEGTVFSIYLPLVPAASITAPRKEGRTIVGGDETILVVEDNAQVLELARLILRGAGYTVLTASNGEEALDQFPRRAKDIDLVLMDVVMPKMGGREVRIQMKRIDPAVRILFTSGYSAAGIHTDFILEEGLDFIQKPFVTDTLRGKIRSILDRSGTLLHQPRAAR